MKIKAILVDDEPKSIAILQNKIERLCPKIEIVATTQNPKDAKPLILEHAPDIVFLDVAMPEISGFDVLASIENPTFEVIFATAFDNYAIDAIKHCAIGYLVKPIDNTDLVEAVEKAIKNCEEKTALQKNRLLIENLDIKTFQDKKVIIPTQEGLEFIEIHEILHCEGVDGYTKIHIKNKRPLLSSHSVGYFCKMFTNQDFYQVHKSHLINLNHIDKYLNEGYVIIGDHNIPVSRNRRTEFLEMLKNGA